MGTAATLPRLAQSRWMPALVIAVALTWVVLSLAQLVWHWLTPMPDEPAVDALAPSASVLEQSLPLAQFRLFGSAVDPAGGAYADAPDTTLNFVLKGTNSHHQQRLARAVIADDQQAERVYKVGDEFPNGVSVQAIYPDRVVLNAAGRIEVLRLRQAQISRSADAPGSAVQRSAVAVGSDGLIGLNHVPPSAPGSVNPMAVVTTPIDWEAVRQQAIVDPGSIAKAFSVLPVMVDGKLAGVRVSSNTYGAQLAQAGLKPDDIVTAVNGRRLDSIESGYAALDSLKSAGAVSLTVNRDGSEKTLPAIRMPQ